jgi:AcrR family transcriptional regulator
MSKVKVTRQEKAAQTRSRMLDAAYQCFCEAGYRATTMANIAERSGVAVQTLYFTFHTKDELFQAVHDRTVLGPDELPPPRQPWHAKMTAAPGVSDAIHHLVTGVEVILARVAPLLPAFQAVSEDPAGAVWRRGEQLRLDGYRDLVAELSTKAPLRRGLSRSQATDLLFVLLSPDLYRALVLERGWPASRWRGWLEQSILHDIFEQ